MPATRGDRQYGGRVRVTSDPDRTRVRLEEVRDDIRTLEAALPEPLTLEPAIQEITATLRRTSLSSAIHLLSAVMIDSGQNRH